MPEHAEVRINADFINHELSSNKKIIDIIVNPVIKKSTTKLKEELLEHIDFPVTMQAITRGKELKLDISDSNEKHVSVVFGLGMSGSFYQIKRIDHASQLPMLFKKHFHVIFVFDDKSALGYNDVRRFGSWQIRDFNLKRGPDPVKEFDAFKEKVLQNLNSKKFTTSTIAEVLMNQDFFNGIGNYLRSTILYHANQNPFQLASVAIAENPTILDLCKEAPMIAYEAHGYKLKSWVNPSTMADKLFNEKELMFLNYKYYNQGLSCTDGTKRTLWFEPRWENECPYKITSKQ